MNEHKQTRWLIPLVLLVILSSGCASNQKYATGSSEDAQPTLDEHDPWQRYNRAMHKFNDSVDRAVIKPMATGYRRAVPAPVRRSVGNFFRNLLEPTTIINSILQGKITRAANATGRFVINSTVGILGLFDVATRAGLDDYPEDFGQTFAVWGIASGPYLVLPFLGPSNVRDAIGLVPYYAYTDPRLALDSTEARAALIGVDVIDRRAHLLGASRLLELQLDPYIFTRESYRQKRTDLIYDGDPPLDENPPL